MQFAKHKPPSLFQCGGNLVSAKMDLQSMIFTYFYLVVSPTLDLCSIMVGWAW